MPKFYFLNPKYQNSENESTITPLLLSYSYRRLISGILSYWLIIEYDYCVDIDKSTPVYGVFFMV